MTQKLLELEEDVVNYNVILSTLEFGDILHLLSDSTKTKWGCSQVLVPVVVEVLSAL